MQLLSHPAFPLACLLAALLPSAALAATPLQNPDGEAVSGEPVISEPVPSEPLISEPVPSEPVPSEIAPAPGSPTQVPIYRNPAAANCPCRACAAKRGSAWSQYKARKQEQYWGYPEYFEEVGFGQLSADLIRPQITRGEDARMTIYDYDFVTGTARLNSRGLQRVRQLAHRAVVTGQTITVEATGTDMDDARYQSVIAIAATEHLNPAQVVSGQPIAGGLAGEEAVIHRQTGLENARNYGVRQFQFGAGSGGFSTSGFGTSGSGLSGGTR